MTETQPPIRPITALNLSYVNTDDYRLIISHSIKTALSEAGYESVHQLSNLSASDLSSGEPARSNTRQEQTPDHRAYYCIELDISLIEAGNIIRASQGIVNPVPGLPAIVGGKGISSSVTLGLLDANTATTATALIPSSPNTRFSTLSSILDTLIATHSESAASTLSANIRGRSLTSSGAIMPGMAVEVSGPPGIGKSSLAVGLTMSARVGKKSVTGSDAGKGERQAGEVLIIDTEGGITPGRLHKAALAITRSSKVTATSILAGIHLVRIATQVQMIAFLNLLDLWLEAHPMVHLVIIDSLSYHFRQPTLDLSARRRVMDTVKQQIGKATAVRNCAVVVTTQMATKLLTAEGKRSNFDTGDKAVLMPQLGEMWQTAKTLRIALFRGPDGNEVRYAHVGTANSDDESNGEWACFDIDSDGLPMDIEEEESQ